jgi:soluble lytic murein transglycosylase-like protein
MNVDPTNAQNVMTRLPIYQPEGVPLGESQEQEEAEETQEVPPTSSQGSLASIDKQFAALISGLSQQLKALESQLTQALNQLSNGNQPAAPPDCGDAPPGPAGKPRYHRYGKIITDAARRCQMDPLLVRAVIGQESGFQANAISKTGAQGLMQLMPDTARSLGVHDAFDPKQNIEGGATLLRQLMDRYHGKLDLALAAYNAGPGAVDKYGGVPPYPETQAYVRNVMATYREGALST